jgi:hypothetical protein
MKRRVARILALIAIALAMVTVRVVWSSRGEWRAACASSGEEHLAHLGRAARLYAPGNPYSRRATEELATLGRAGGPDALAAWREVRSSILATRSIYTPHRALLDEANREIASRMAASETDARGPYPVRRAWHAARLAEDDAPSVGWSLLALFGLAAWVGSAFGFFWRAIDDQDRLRRRPAIACAAGIAVGLVLFFLGLARA